MHIVVFGASGRTGEPLVRQAVDRGHTVSAFVRDPDRFPIKHDSVSIVTGDAYTGEGVSDAVAGVDAVVSVLGQTDDGPDDLLTVAGEHIVEAMQSAGVSRLITLVGAGVREEGESVSLTGRIMGTALRLMAGSVLEDAKEHVEIVRASDLDWTVVRVPRLSEGAGAGEYRAGDIALGIESIARADVARFILDCLEGERYVRELPKVGPA